MKGSTQQDREQAGSHQREQGEAGLCEPSGRLGVRLTGAGPRISMFR